MSEYTTTETAGLIASWQATYDAHDHSGGFMACKSHCAEGFPCETRIRAASALTGLGVMLYTKSEFLKA